MWKSIVHGFILVALGCSVGRADVVRLDYTASDVATGGKYAYEFRLTLDNTDGTWSSGQGWGWIVFGDVPSGTSPIADFSLTSVAAPFTGLTSTFGGHNGPTLQPIYDGVNYVYWVPSNVGDTLSWTGRASQRVTQGLEYSALLTTGGATGINFGDANFLGTAFVAPVPLPAAAWGGIALFGLIGATKLRGRKANAAC